MNLKDETSKNLGKKSSKGKKNVSFEYGATKSIWREFGVSKIFRETEDTTQCGFLHTVWKSRQKCYHEFCGKMNIFSVKSTYEWTIC